MTTLIKGTLGDTEQAASAASRLGWEDEMGHRDEKTREEVMSALGIKEFRKGHMEMLYATYKFGRFSQRTSEMD